MSGLEIKFVCKVEMVWTCAEEGFIGDRMLMVELPDRGKEMR